MKRRDFIAGLGGAIAWPVVVRAQQAGRSARVAFWMGGTDLSDPLGQRYAAALRDALRQLGWVEGRNLRLDVRWGNPSLTPEQTRTAAAELVALGPDVIVTTGAPILDALHRQTKSVPIVFTMVTDPVRDGFVTSPARPGGNITGFTIFEHSFAGKWLEMLKEVVVPSVARVAVMQNQDHPAWNAYLRAISSIAQPMGVEVTPAP